MRSREEDSSLSDKVGWRGLAKQDESSILRRWARLYPTTSDGGARLFSEREEGACEARRIVDPSTMGSSLLITEGAGFAETQSAGFAEAFSDWEEGSSGSDIDRQFLFSSLRGLEGGDRDRNAGFAKVSAMERKRR